MPADYTVCWHSTCPMAGNCLRHLASEHIGPEKRTVWSVNLGAISPESGECPMQRPVRWVQNAYGMRRIYQNVRVGDKEMLYHTIWSALGNSMYYRYRNGRRPITPEVQTVVAEAFRRFGYTKPVAYDRMEEAVDW